MQVPAQTGTKQQILAVALELFTNQGYADTSLRQIAERVGVSKAALYYHFPSKGDILLGLHARLHALIDGPLATLGEPPISAEHFEEFLDVAIDTIQENELLFRLHRENQAALMALHDNETHGQAHIDMQDRLRAIFTDGTLADEERVRRMAASMVALFLPMAAREFYPGEDLVQNLRVLIKRILETPL